MKRPALPVKLEAALIKEYTPLVRQVAASLQRIRPAHLEREDALHDGMIGLLRGLRANNNELEDHRFIAYLRACVRGAIIDSYRLASPIPRREYAQAKRTLRAITQGVAVAPAETALARWVMATAWAEAQPLDDESVLAVADPFPGPEQRLISNELLRKAIDALHAQPVRNRTVFIACEIDGDTNTAVAARFGVSVGRVSQIVKQVRQQLFAALAAAL